MVYQRVAHYLWLKGDTYYFNRRVPKDMQGHYKASRIIICLKNWRVRKFCGMVRLRRLELPRGVNPTATSTLRVYQFRHSRTLFVR